MSDTHQPGDREILKRARRIETRLTALSNFLGLETGQHPTFHPPENPGNARIVLPSIHTSIKEALDTTPEAWDGPVDVIVDGQVVAVIARSRNLSRR